MKAAENRDDEFFMRQALSEALKAQEKGEVPVGAIIVSGQKILSRAHNKCISRSDPTAHAEIIALRKACRKRKNYRLEHCDLYVTLEPCTMCLGAAVQARIRKIIFGALDPKAGAVKSILRFPFEKTNHWVEVKCGILAQKCVRVLRDFFKNKRTKKRLIR